jgi:hypothetical protein
VRTYHIAWWTWRTCSTRRMRLRWDDGPRAIKNDIAGWTPQLRDRKLRPNLTEEISIGRRPDPLTAFGLQPRAPALPAGLARSQFGSTPSAAPVPSN